MPNALMVRVLRKYTQKFSSHSFSIYFPSIKFFLQFHILGSILEKYLCHLPFTIYLKYKEIISYNLLLTISPYNLLK